MLLFVKKCLNNIMKKLLILLILCSVGMPIYAQPSFPKANDYTIELARLFSKDIFVNNGVPYLQPLVEAMNATSNSAFYNNAYVPKEVDKPYFKISVNGMMGIVPDNKKIYKPQLPTAEFDLYELDKYVEFSLFPTPGISQIKDTAGLLAYALKVYAGRGLASGSINPPATSPTILGKGQSVFIIPRSVLDSLVRTYPDIGGRPLFDFLSDSMQLTLLTTINQFPEYYTLPDGADINTLIVGVPQFEIGSFMGTELLVRFIPPVNWGKTIGDFAFWGLGLKHSISQYFPERWFDLAVQAVYQGTYLKNEVGVTKANLTAYGTIWNFNIHASKEFEGVLDLYAGFSYDWIGIQSKYEFLLPVELQLQLGLLEREQIGIDDDGNPIWRMLPPNENFPGDNQVQKLDLKLNDNQIRATFGISKRIGSFRLFAEYHLSKFDIISAGLQIIL